jgi:hypothetical protein
MKGRAIDRRENVFELFALRKRASGPIEIDAPHRWFAFVVKY